MIAIGTTLLIVSFLGFFGHGTIGNVTYSYMPYNGTDVIPFTGNVTIYPNGTFTMGAPITKSGDTYTLTSEIIGTLTDMFNGSVINGNGYMINGTGKVAFDLVDANDVSVSDLSVFNSSIGFDLYYSHNISMNDLGFHGKITYGIYMNYVNVIDVSNSAINGTSSYGIFSIYSDHVIIDNNAFSNNSYGIYLDNSNILTVKDDTFNILRNDGIVSLNSDNITVDNVSFSHLSQALDICFSKNVIVTDLRSTDGKCGPEFYSDSNFSLIDSNITCDSRGLYIPDSTQGKIVNSIFSKPTECLIDVEHSTDIAFINDSMNQTVNGYCDIFAEYSTVSVYNSTMHSITFSIHLDGGTFSGYNSYFNSSEYVFCAGDGASVHLSGDTIDESSTTHQPFYIYNHFNIITVNNSRIEAPKGGDSYAFYMSQSRCTQSSNSMELNNDVISNFYSGVYLYGFPLSNLAINGTTFYNISYPVYSEEGALKVTVTDNTLYNNSDCMVYIYCAESFNISGNRILGNVSGDGFTVYYTDSYSVIENNFIENSRDYGIYLYEGYYVYLSGNTINNSYGGIYSEYSHESDIWHNSISNSTYGIYVYCLLNGSVYDNNVVNSAYGIYTYYSSGDRIYSNTLNHDNDSIYACYPYKETFFSNTVENTKVAVYLYDETSTYGTCNVIFYHNNFINFSNVEVLDGSFALWDQGLPIGGNYWSNYTGTGINGIGTTPEIVNGSNVDYYPLTYRWIYSTVTFIEIGLPSGTTWGVTEDGYNLVGSGNIVYQETNGQFMNVTFTPDHVSGYVPVKNDYTIDLEDSSLVVYVEYKPYNYSLSFTETGLASGTTWSVDLNGTVISSSSSTIIFSVPNGTYNYTISAIRGYNLTVSSGYVKVKSSSSSVEVTFSQTKYGLTFTETGLPAGMKWYVSIDGQNLSATGNSITFYEVNGNYSYTVYAPAGYTVENSTGHYTLNYASANVSITILPIEVKAKASNSDLYVGLGTGAVIGLVIGSVATVAFIRRKNPGKGKS